MLILDIKINYSKIDCIQVQRIKGTKSGHNTYKIIEPAGFEKFTFKHHYDEGYFGIVIKVIDILKSKEYNPKPPYTWKELQRLIKQQKDWALEPFIKLERKSHGRKAKTLTD